MSTHKQRLGTQALYKGRTTAKRGRQQEGKILCCVEDKEYKYSKSSLYPAYRPHD